MKGYFVNKRFLEHKTKNLGNVVAKLKMCTWKYRGMKKIF